MFSIVDSVLVEMVREANETDQGPVLDLLVAGGVVRGALSSRNSYRAAMLEIPGELGSMMQGAFQRLDEWEAGLSEQERQEREADGPKAIHLRDVTVFTDGKPYQYHWLRIPIDRVISFGFPSRTS